MSAEKEAADALAQNPGLLKWALGIVSAALSALLGITWKYHGLEIKEIKVQHAELEKEVDSKVEGLRAGLRDAFRQQREDKSEILEAIRDLAQQQSNNHATVLTELANRPLRR